jgi:O-antigen/teichoic acid export membrane protein
VSSPPSAAVEGHREAARVARDSAVVFFAGLFDQSVRVGVTWVLARTLGAADVGRYTLIVTTAAIFGVFAPWGLQSAVIVFLARDGADARWRKSTLVTALSLAAILGVAAAVAFVVWIGIDDADPDPGSMAIVAPAVAANALLLVSIGILRAARDLRGQALALQVALPVGLAVGAGFVGWGGGGIQTALVAYVFSYFLAVVLALGLVIQRHGALLSDAAVGFTWRRREMLRFSAPQGATDVLYRLNLWMDVIALGHLSSLPEVGRYRVAAALAMVAGVPVMAIQSAFFPLVAELARDRAWKRLEVVVRALTRWLLVALGVPLLAVVGWPEAWLSLFDRDYASSAEVLTALFVGQAIQVAFAALVPVLPTSGRAAVEMINGTLVLVLNLVLNLAWIPRFGALGAAWASVAAIAAWSSLRWVEARWALGVSPWSARSYGLVAVLAILAWFERLFIAESPRVRLVTTATAVAAFAVFAYFAGLDAGDRRRLGALRSQPWRWFTSRRASSRG